MQHLSHNARLALTMLLSVAIILPLILLTSRYVSWEVASKQRAALTQSGADTSVTLPY